MIPYTFMSLVMVMQFVDSPLELLLKWDPMFLTHSAS